ncbi:hypothetical protein [Pontibacter vulgaris]|uniref:hypothetical protein n=1 Tax=Pontibacter vulgaris TaxID=2905679 RepID=UPI001FA7F232|nr:hypothetical protein [Pontibacter vulgaris]
MKGLLLFTLILVLVACEKSEDSVPYTSACVVSTTLTENYSLDGMTIELKYVRDETTGRLIEIQRFEDNTNYGNHKYTYDDKGNIIQRDFYISTGDLQARQTYEYDSNNQLTYSLSSYVPDISNGKLIESTSYTYEYASPTQLKKITIHGFRISTNQNYTITTITFDYKNGQIYKIHVYNNENQLRLSYIIEYDDKNNKLVADTAYRKTLFPPESLPLKHNIKKILVDYLINGGETTWGHTSTFTYNKEGYPIQEIRTLLDGYHYTLNYTYRCK